MRPLRRDRPSSAKTWVLDIETTGLGEPVSRQAACGRPPRQLLCCIYDGTEERSFWGDRAIQDALTWLIERDEDADVYAHYGGGFDFRFAHEWLFDRVKRSGKNWRVVTSGSFVIVCGGEIDGVKLRLIDSYRLLPGSLAEIGRAVGMQKLDWNHDFHRDPAWEGGKKRFRLHAPICYQALESYCKRDCQVLFLGLAKIREFALSQGISLKMTIAATATASIRRKLDFDTIAWAPKNVTLDSIRACFGGRVEPFAERCSHANVFDIQSSYPKAMTMTLPWRYIESRPSYRRGMIGMVKARVRVPDDCTIPVLPYRMMHGPDKGRVFFPTGEWEGFFYSRELDYARKVGAAEILATILFHRFEKSNVLKKFALAGWKARKGAVGFLRYALKIWLNACYGKTNEKTSKEIIVVHPPTDSVICRRHRDTPRQTGEGPCACRVPVVPRHGLYAIETEMDPAFRAPWVAAAITATARMRLHEFFMKALAMGGKLFYADTDSAVTDASLDTGTELGELGLERRVSDGRFIGPKMYAFRCEWCDSKDQAGRPIEHPHDVVKSKGFTRLTREQFDRLDRCDCGSGYRSGTAFGCPACGGGSLSRPGTGRAVLHFERTEGFREALSRGRVGYRRIEVSRQLRQTTPKRSPEGRPWSVVELEEMAE